MDLLLLNNYVEPDGDVSELLGLAQEHGFAGVEVRLANLSEVTDLQAQQRLDGQLLWNGNVDLVQDDASARQSAIDEYERKLSQMSRFAPQMHNLSVGAIQDPSVERTTVEAHGSAIASDEHWQRAIEGLRHLADLAASHGMRLTLEIHPLTLHDTAENALRLARAVEKDNLGVTLEPGNLAQHPGAESPEQAIEILGDRLFHVHLKNLQFLRGSRACRISGLDEGDINLRRCLQCLRGHGYDGPCTIESTHRGDRRWMLRRDVAYLRHLLEILSISSSMTQPAGSH